MFDGKGVGINVEVCGFPTSKKALLKFKHIAPVEIYQLNTKSVMNDSLGFKKSGDLDDPLLRQLWLVRGDTSSSIELMMKYYQESSNRFKKAMKRNKKDNEIKSQEASNKREEKGRSTWLI